VNKTYRVVWSVARQLWVVASELASVGGKDKTRCVVSRMLCAALLLGGLLAGRPETALALSGSCGPGTNSTIAGTVTGTCNLAAADTLTLSNSGKISATATATNTSSLSTTGVFSSVNFTGTLTNSGSISAAATLNGSTNFSIDVTAYGVRVSTLSGTLDNSGTITATATNNANETSSTTLSVIAYGVFATTLSGTLDNSGTISATATNNGNNISSSISVTAYGVRASTLSGTLDNNGTISATATNNGNASNSHIRVTAYGVFTNTLSGTLTNTGTISATAGNSGTASTAIHVTAYGVRVSTLSGTLTNSGTINATGGNSGTGSTTTINVRGAQINTLSTTGTLSNSGTISASATGTGAQTATGVRITGNIQAGGIFNNSGTISATVSNGIATNAYSLRVDASAGGTINNLAGGLLRGRLSVVGAAAVNNAGTIEIPDGVTGSIAGNYTQQAGGVLRIGASSAASFGKLTVGGTADLTASGTFDVNVAGVNTLATGNVLTGALTATTLNAGAITVTDNSALFDFTGVVDGAGTGVDLSIVAAAVGGGASTLSSVQASGFTPGIGAAQVYDSLIGGAPASADMGNVVTALGTLATQQQVSNAVAQSVPLMSGGAPLTGLTTARSISHILETKLAAMQGMASGDGFFSKGTLWLKPFGSLAHQDDRNGASGFDADSYGLMIGANTDISERTNLALGFAWSRSFIDSNSSVAVQSTDVDSFQLAASGSINLDADTVLTLSANGGINLNDGQRNITFGGLSRIARSDYDSWTAHLGAEFGRRFNINEKVSFMPSLRADYTVIRDDSYTETGAGALNLKVDSHTTDELLLGVDGRLRYAVTDATTLNINVGAAYDAISEQSSLTSAFAGAPGAGFTTAGIDPSHWQGRGGIGLTVKVADNIDITAGYDAEVRSDFSNHTGSIKLAWAF